MDISSDDELGPEEEEDQLDTSQAVLPDVEMPDAEQSPPPEPRPKKKSRNDRKHTTRVLLPDLRREVRFQIPRSRSKADHMLSELGYTDVGPFGYRSDTRIILHRAYDNSPPEAKEGLAGSVSPAQKSYNQQ